MSPYLCIAKQTKALTRNNTEKQKKKTHRTEKKPYLCKCIFYILSNRKQSTLNKDGRIQKH